MFHRVYPTFTALARSTLPARRPGRLVSPGSRCKSVCATTTRSLATIASSDDARHDSHGTAIVKKYPSAIAQRLPDPDTVHAPHRFREFELNDRVFVVTGGAQGLCLTLAEALVEAGGRVYCLDKQDEPHKSFDDTKNRLAKHYGGSLHYRQVDVQHADQLDHVIGEIATKYQRLDGLIAGAAIQKTCPALEYPPDKVSDMMDVNYRGVYLSAVACARQMIKYKTPGSMILVGSMSGMVANRDLICSVYNSSKAAVIQLGRSLAMEWGRIMEIDGEMKAIRVNVLCPGNIETPMVEKNFNDQPDLKPKWEDWNMMGRISKPHEYRGAALFMLSDASSFMTGSSLVIDGGYTAW